MVVKKTDLVVPNLLDHQGEPRDHRARWDATYAVPLLGSVISVDLV